MGYVARVHVEHLADCPFSAAQEYLEDYLRKAQAGGDEAEIRVSTGVPGLVPPIARRAAVSFGLRSDRGDRGRGHDEIVLRWSGRSRLLPEFRGTIRTRIAQQRTLLVFDGTYVPPGGLLGAAFDVLVGRRIARASLSDLAERLAETLGERERAWRSAIR